MNINSEFINFPDRVTIPNLHRFCDSLVYSNKRRHKEPEIAKLMKTHNAKAQDIINELTLLYSEMLKTKSVDFIQKNKYVELTRKLYQEVLSNPIGKKQAKDINRLLKSMSLEVSYNFYYDLIQTQDIDKQTAALFDQFANFANKGQDLMADKILVELQKRKITVDEGSYYVMVLKNKRCIMAMF